ncbi:MAG: enoyl-CoA hydratase/isomerase family protein [Phycisphaerae bacterium]|jgi:enoyl-CoA hydratase
MSNTQVRLNIDGSSATITLSTEQGLNVLAPDVLQSFGAAVAKVKGDGRVRTTVVRAEGKVFVAGADIKAMENYSPDDAREYGSIGQGVFSDLTALPSVTVAAINGAALGGGLELALACDFRIAVKSAKLGLPEVTLGLIPGWAGIGRLTKLVGQPHAKKLYLTGVPVSAEDGLGFGLVDEIVNSVEDLAPRVTAFCRTFRRAAPSAVALAKRASRDMDDLTAFADSFRTPECREGIGAFLQKRPASWMEE